MPDCPGIHPTLLGDSQSGARGRVFDQLSWEPRASARGSMGLIDVLGDLGPDSSARGFDQLSRVTRPHIRRPARSINFPGRFGPVSMGPWCRPTVPGVLGQGPKARGIDQHSCASHTHVRRPRRRPAVLENSGLCPRSHGLEQLSWGTWARVLGTTVWTSSPRLLALGRGGLLCRPTLPGDSGPCPMSRRL